MRETMIHLNIYNGSTHLRLDFVNQCPEQFSLMTCIIVFYLTPRANKAQAYIKLYINILPFVLPVTCAIFCVRTILSIVNASFSSLTLGDIKR